MAKKDYEETPLMKQYSEMKVKYPDAIMLFRMGDFYETFGSDAIIASKILGITLTKRSHGSPGDVELAGFPHHALDTYLPKLVRAGQRVAICEQLEDPKKTKKLVKRGVIELVTPGVSYGEYALDSKGNIFLAAVYFNKNGAGLSLLDLSTGEFLTTEGDVATVDKILNSFQPKEVLYPKGKEEQFKNLFGSKFYIYPFEEWFFEYEAAKDKVLKHFEVKSLKGFGIDNMNLGISSAGAILNYLEMTKHDMLGHITSVSRIDESNYVLLDKFSLRNLELLHASHDGGKSLAEIMDRTITPMGSRMLRRWISMPLKSIEKIEERLHITECLIAHETERLEIEVLLRSIGDLERLASKIASGRISPREMVQLKVALSCIPAINELCLKMDNASLTALTKNLDECRSLYEKIRSTIRENAPNAVNKGMVIAEGVCAELDELRNISEHGKELLLDMQQRESIATGIPSLKIGFNNVFGYYIEVTRTHKDKAPDTWIRKQTLANAERYITPELKEYEDKILGAEDKILEIESALFNQLLQESCSHIRQIQINAQILGAIDTLLSFAEISITNKYCKPQLNESDIINIKDGRHPVIERQLPPGEEYVANDVLLDNEQQQIIIITGPNMAGKSALLRQTALIVIMAQAGCFIPASSAEIGYVDKVFTRVGASDNISQGESTFMVEMNEAANILNNISDRSLVLFDELGRGTSTYDGISIAWAIVEYLHDNPKYRAKTLFATHYHELNEMEHSFKKIKNFNVSVKEINNNIVFLRKLVRGGSNHSFGIQVGRMAGLPLSVTRRADDILKQLENDRDNNGKIQKNVEHIASEREGTQLSFFQLEDPVLCQIRDQIAGMDINNLTPIEALNKLNEIKKITGI
ncbi:DNA mismatch repair protein MutS [Porphyromonadaceae bacterium OttesenSCG-928-L07]|nr:DNA mismatch repair protein MutS [Porphyromonadaceae bacterium OttesenSCG-928-L07]MDL2330787.1 DNA mismatch repair protein MutS [Odoribacter sp. OttesenSCG-928-A06]